MVMIWGHKGSRTVILRFDLERPISDLESNNSKFHGTQFFRIDPKNIYKDYHRSPIKTVGQVSKMVKISQKTKMTSVTLTLTLRSLGYVDLVQIYLPYKCEHDQRSLRQSNAYFQVWPWTPYIWPWGQKFKIPPQEISAYNPKEHVYAFLLPYYQNCRRR